MDCGYGAYVDLMKRYPLVTDAFLQLKPGYQKACLRPSLLCIAGFACPYRFFPLLSCSLSAYRHAECRSKSFLLVTCFAQEHQSVLLPSTYLLDICVEEEVLWSGRGR